MRRSQLPIDLVLQGDCVDLLRDLPERSIDLIFADPPYNLQLTQPLWRPNATLVDGVADEWDRFESYAEYDSFSKAWLEACRRVLKPTGTLWVIGTYHNIFRLGTIVQDLGYWILNDVVWIKTNPMPNFRGVRFTNAHETLIWAARARGARYTFNHHAMKSLNDDLQMRSDWTLPVCGGRERIRLNGEKAHSAQKPESLLYRIIQAASSPGDVVLDPFFGTGTTGAVAKGLGRHWIGIDTSPGYCDLARKRIEAVNLPRDRALYVPKDQKRERRVPFGLLLELGLIRAGDRLLLKGTELGAVVLADGRVKAGRHEGSIHTVGAALLGGACNGWAVWEYLSPRLKKRASINDLRRKARARLNSMQMKERSEKRRGK